MLFSIATQVKLKQQHQYVAKACLLPVAIETDPLDVIASELAMHDEFVLMDEVGYETELKSKPDVTTKPGPDAEKASADGRDDEDQKEAVSELDRKDIDLADIDVDEARAGKDGDDDMDISQQERGRRSFVAKKGRFEFFLSKESLFRSFSKLLWCWLRDENRVERERSMPRKKKRKNNNRKKEWGRKNKSIVV